MGSHFGNLEYSRGIAHRHPDLVINILIYDQHAAKFAALLTKSAPESRLNLIQVTELDLDRALQPADFPIGPYVLANLLHCPVYLMNCFNAGGEYKLGFELFAEEVRPSRVNQRRSYANEVQRFATALEAQVCRAPLQWFNFFDFWATHRDSI